MVPGQVVLSTLAQHARKIDAQAAIEYNKIRLVAYRACVVRLKYSPRSAVKLGLHASTQLSAGIQRHQPANAPRTVEKNCLIRRCTCPERTATEPL